MKKFIILICAVFVASAAELNLNKLCQGILFATLPHPDDPNLFIGCVQGKGTVLGCNDFDDIFDPIEVSCVNRFLTTTRSPTQQICDENGEGLFASEDDCRDYIVCESSGPSVRRCPNNSIFDPLLPGCVFGNTVTCEIYVGTTQPPTTIPPTTLPPTTLPPTLPPTTLPPTTLPPTLPPTTLPPTTLSPTTLRPTGVPPTSPPNISFQCPIEGFGNIPHATICSRYYECVQGVRFSRTCDEGLIFDVITKRCNLPELSICSIDIRCVDF